MSEEPLETARPDRTPMVAVIGAGVAGLTAAHELAERGFDVYVYEQQADPLRRPALMFPGQFDARPESKAVASLLRSPHVGGLAATQWCRVPDPRYVGGAGPEMARASAAANWYLASPDDWDFVKNLSEADYELKMWEARWPLLPFGQHEADLGVRWTPRIQRIAERLDRRMRATREHEVVAIGGWVSADECTPHDPDGAVLAMKRAKSVFDDLCAALRGLGWSRGGIEAPTGVILAHPDGQTFKVSTYALGAELNEDRGGRLPAVQRYAEIRIMDVLLPAEHGYRFFPSFYHHVFDTMRRIPLMESRSTDAFKLGARRDAHRRDVKNVGPALDPVRPSSRTVFDNLRSVEVHAFGGDGQFPLRALPRSNMLSVRSMLDLLDTIQQQAGVSMRDITRGQIRTLKFLTSCAQRREQYEHITWWDFVGAEQGSREFQELLIHWPQALVGLRARDADARTFGTVLMQLLLDQLRPGGYRDGTLNGPTSEAWLDPWRDYLQRELRVKFNTCHIDGISFRQDRSGRMWPQLRGAIGGDSTQSHLLVPDKPGFDYVVVATSIDAAATLACEIDRGLRAQEGAPKSDWLREQFDLSPLSAALESVVEAKDYQTNSGSGGAFRHFAGIQYFLDTDYAPLRGHVYYPKSPWRLSSVSQAQFRQDRPGVGDGYLGVISVVIGAWDTPGMADGPSAGKCAWECTEKQIADEVWGQMMSLALSEDERPPRPRRYWIDDNIRFSAPTGERGGRPERNNAPFLVNLAAHAGRWPERPGEYEVYFDSVVFAGTYVRTFTRLVTMEAANESARHAVNAILRHCRKVPRSRIIGQPCTIFDPEARELEDLGLLKRVDEQLVARGLPHMLDILGVEDVTIDLVGTDEGSPATILSALRRLGETSGGIFREMVGFLRDTVSRH